MDAPLVRYAVLRDNRHWDGVSLAGLQPETDGVLTLVRLPSLAVDRPIVLPGPYDVEPSGLAVGDCGDIYLSHTAQHRVIRIDGVCDGERTALPGIASAGSAPGQFNFPRGLLVTNNSLYVADGGNGRVQVFHLPTLELSAIWEGPLQGPTGLAADSQGRIYVLDRGLKRVLRFNAWGAPDEAYNTAMAQHAELAEPFGLAIVGEDILCVTDKGSNSVLRFDSSSQMLAALPKGSESPTHPRAIAVYGNTLYIADADSGLIWVADGVTRAYLGTLTGYRGPVAALAVDEAGALYVKPDAGETFYSFQAATAYLRSGILTAGPLDAGELTEWERVHVLMDLPDHTTAELRLFTAATDTQAPDWTTEDTLARALDTLLMTVPAIADKPSAARRYLWLRVTLQSDDPRASPRLIQIQAETTTESYLDYLPTVYRRQDTPARFLHRWLALFRSQLSDLELILDDMARCFDPATTPEEYLPWLAKWLAFDLPPNQDADKWRELLARAYAFYHFRGTPSGLRDFVQLYTDVHPVIYEAFQERRVWQLGETAALGFDTALAPALPDGMIVPGETWADPQYMGLRGDYYSGIDFDQWRLTRTDRKIDFDWKDKSPESSIPADYFSVRWTGQVQPRHSEIYTFYTLSDDGVRLWVDGQLIIDKWIDQSPTTHSGQIALTAGRWYAITLEYYEKTGAAVIQLSWSSRSQPKEIIPQTQLYSVRDEGARLKEAQPESSRAEPILVGQTVVGQSGPLESSDFGMPLFDETAHLFTVLVPASQLPTPEQRQALRRIVEAEKPAHTDFHLCFVEAQMRVGFQARIGIDTILAGAPPLMTMTGAVLGLDSYLSDEGTKDAAGRVARARLGQDTIIG